MIPESKKVSKLPLIAIAAAILLGGIGYFMMQNRTEKLFIYTWDTYADTELFAKFEAETGIRVVTEVYSSNDALLAKLKSGARYDIIAPSGNYVPLLIKENLLQPLSDDLRKLGSDFTDNVRNPAYDPEYRYALPLFYGTTGIAVNTSLTDEKIVSWKDFFNRPSQEAPLIGMLDDTSTVMAVGAIALARKNCDGSENTLKMLENLLTGQRPSVKTYSANGYFERLAANEVALQLAWSGDVYTARQENPAIKYIYPKEGVELWMDSLAIPAAAQNPKAAEKFIAFVLQPENAAAYSNFSGNIPTTRAARDYLPADIQRAPEFNIPPNVATHTSFACPPAVIQAYGRIWENLMR